MFCVSEKQFSGQLGVVSRPPKVRITLSVLLVVVSLGKCINDTSLQSDVKAGGYFFGHIVSVVIPLKLKIKRGIKGKVDVIFVDVGVIKVGLYCEVVKIYVTKRLGY